MKIIFSEQCEIRCRTEEIDEAMEFLKAGNFKVQTIVYGEVVKVEGRSRGGVDGVRITAARSGLGRRWLRKGESIQPQMNTDDHRYQNSGGGEG